MAFGKSDKNDALVIKTKESKYLEVLMVMRSDAKLVNPRAQAHQNV